MKLIIKNNRIVAMVTDDYFGPDTAIDAPDGFDIDRAGEYTLVEGIASLPSMSKQIDDAVLAVYSRPMAFSKEYEAREKAAAEYKAAGYVGTIPDRLTGFATPAGLTAKAAADVILAQSKLMRDALDALSDLRMVKFAVQQAATEEEANIIGLATLAEIAAIAAILE